MYRIEVNLDELRDAITALENFPLAKRETILPGLGAVLAAAVARGFNEEADPVTGAAWADLSPVTIARRAEAGHDGKKLDGRVIHVYPDADKSRCVVIVADMPAKKKMLRYAPNLDSIVTAYTAERRILKNSGRYQKIR
jgi:hypothetical protein